MNSFSVPILFIIFNRPETTQAVFEQIKIIKPAILFIAADGPRNHIEADKANCANTRDIVKRIDWDCKVETLFNEKNLGCGFAVSNAINWFFKHNAEGIILEDDCLPNVDFFHFCAHMLQKYRNDKRIISINGSNLGFVNKTNDSYTFSRFMNMWGWATWNDRALQIDYNIKEWAAIKRKKLWLYKKLRQNFFDFDWNWFLLWDIKFNKVFNEPNFTWDWQWIFFQLNHQYLSVVPSKNLVVNLGFNQNATHTTNTDNPSAKFIAESLPTPFITPKQVKNNISYEEYNIKWVWCYHKRLHILFYVKKFFKEIFF